MADTAVKLTARDEFAIAAFHALMTSEKVKAKTTPGSALDLFKGFARDSYVIADLMMEASGRALLDALKDEGEGRHGAS